MNAIAVVLIVIAAESAAAGEVTISDAGKDDRGILVHEVESPCQAGKTHVRVLLPTKLEAGRKYPVVYVLPVEARDEDRYGNGMREVHKLGLPDKHGAIFVAPTFSHLPWYVDHPTDPAIRQETCFLKVVLPFVEKTYPVLAGQEGRLLLGFSKSGWGAWSLLLRHPRIFGRAAAWDAPLMMERLGRYGTAPIFGTEETLAKCRIPDLLRARAAELAGEPRLILSGYQNFREQHVQAHMLLTDLKVPHEYRDEPRDKHDWHSGWVGPTVELLLPASGDAPAAKIELLLNE